MLIQIYLFQCTIWHPFIKGFMYFVIPYFWFAFEVKSIIFSSVIFKKVIFSHRNFSNAMNGLYYMDTSWLWQRKESQKVYLSCFIFSSFSALWHVTVTIDLTSLLMVLAQFFWSSLCCTMEWVRLSLLRWI